MEKLLDKYPEREVRGAKKLFSFYTSEMVVDGFYNERDGRGNYPFIVVVEHCKEEPHTFELHRANNTCVFENAYNYDIPMAIKSSLKPFRYG